MSQQAITPAWHKRTPGLLAISVICLLAAYLVGSRAIFTGSLQQYVLTGILFILAINRSVAAVRQHREKSHV